MVNMENAEEVMQILERYTRLKQKEIPKELDDYLQYVAKTGETVFKWSSLKYLFREKLLNVIKHFHDTTPRVDEIPQYPNVDPFNYESMKSSLLERLELFNSAPFTIQRLCELLIDPRKQYSRIDKFMRALEKNILVVSTIEPGRKRNESENGDSLDSVVNGDLSLDVNVDIDMENETLFNAEGQNGNGNGTVTPAAEAKGSTTGTSEADGTPPTAVTAEVREKAVTESPNVPHTADDDILPNPKKPKLDLEAVVAEAVAETKSEVSGAAQIVAETKSATDEKENAVAANTNDKTKDVDMEEKEEEENKENQEARVGKEDNAVEIVAAEKQTEEKKKIEVAGSNGGDNLEDVKVESTDDPSKHVDKKQSEIDGCAASKTDAENKASKVEAVTSSSNCKNEEQQKIVEKQETERNEKHTIDTERCEEGDKSCVTPQVVDVMTEAKELIEKEKQSINNDQVNEVADDVKSAQNTKTNADGEVTTTEKTKNIEEKSVATEIEAEAGTGDIVKAEISQSSNIPETTGSKTENEDSTVAAVSTSKSMDEEKPVETEEKLPETTSIVASEEITTSTTNILKTDQETSASDGSNEAVSTTSDASPMSKTKSTQNESAVTTAATSEATSSDAEAVAIVETAGIKETPVPSEETPIAAENEITSAAVVVTPTLSLNDQPMDEQTDVAENIAVAEAASTTPAAVAEVEEVIMTETNSGANVATAMATDAIEPAKDEPSGMEVDDTSQEEAMDQ